MDIFDQYKDQTVCRSVLERIQAEATCRVRFMEVCGTHTVALFHSGIRSLLPENLIHLSGPGCVFQGLVENRLKVLRLMEMP